jgi:2-polyprenyl-3-methyl-5-hydroxy-6-metoxy-1,4-benzoquinol methylase
MTTNSDDYLSDHLRATRDGLGYTRSRYALKAWQTFGGSVPADRSATILDIGPGECELVEYLRDELGYQDVRVMDMSSEVIDLAVSLGFDAELSDDTVSTLADRPGTYDAIFMLHVLEHVPKQTVIPLVTAAHAALRPGGALLIEVPNMGDPLNGLYYRYADFTHEVGFTAESLRYVLTKGGFTDVELLPQVGATSTPARLVQRLARGVLHALLFLVNLPNGRQMRRVIGPVLPVRAVRSR